MNGIELKSYYVYRVRFSEPVFLKLTTSVGMVSSDIELVFFELYDQMCYRVPGNYYGFVVDFQDKILSMTEVGEEKSNGTFYRYTSC